MAKDSKSKAIKKVIDVHKPGKGLGIDTWFEKTNKKYNYSHSSDAHAGTTRITRKKDA